MSAADEGRTEKATSKQRNKFREEGSVAKSQELNSFVQFFAGFVLISFAGGWIVTRMAELMRYSFLHLDMKPVTDYQDINLFYFTETVIVLAPLFFVLLVAAFLSGYAQVGLEVHWTIIKPKWSKVNAFKNLQKVLISKQSMMELFKSVAKLSVISLMAWSVVAPIQDEFANMWRLTPIQIAIHTWEYAEGIWLMIIYFMAVMATIDFGFQKYQMEEQMKMKKQEVEDETKQSMGDPRIKAQQRRRGMQMLQQIMAQNAAEADVVITNPTHFAVALKYKHGAMTAPKVVAKGVDHMALKIRRTARKADVPIVENRSLARALYHAVDVGDEIPEKLFRPVAEILAFVYKLNKQRSA